MAIGKNPRSTNQVELSSGFPGRGDGLPETFAQLDLQVLQVQPLTQRPAVFLPLSRLPSLSKRIYPVKDPLLLQGVPRLEIHSSELSSRCCLLSWDGCYKPKVKGLEGSKQVLHLTASQR